MVRISRRLFQAGLFLSGVRILIYVLLLGGLTALMMQGAVVQRDAFYCENGPVEIVETVFILISALMFLFSARLAPSKTPCSILLTGMIFCGFIREWDDVLDTLIARHAWKIVVTLILVLVVFYSLRRAQEIYASVLEFTNRPCSGIFLSGLLVLLVFSRLFGYGPFWKATSHNDSFRAVKRVTEGGIELMGYLLIFISSCEYLHDALSVRRQLDSRVKGLELFMFS